MTTCSKGELTSDVITNFKISFDSDKKNVLVSNACAKTDPFEICIQRNILATINHIYSHKVDSEIKPMSNQKQSGNCWIYAALNVLRIPFAKRYQLEDFEFSQNYIYFWDKIERCNFLLHNIVEALQKGEPIDGRLMAFLLSNPVSDGGQYDMIVNIIIKYGVMPKKCFPDTFCSETTSRLNGILKSRVREYVRDLHAIIQAEKFTAEMLETKILCYMEEIYRIVAICLGIPPETFTWEYYNKNKTHGHIGPITPLKFYEEHVKPLCDIETKVCLVNDPRPKNPFGHLYTVKYLGNMTGGRKVIYLNLEANELMKYAAESIKNNEAVWFGCEIIKRFARKQGIVDLQLHDYNLVFGTDINKSLSKAEKLIYGDSEMNHAMVFTAVTLDQDSGEPTKFRVENSWGDEDGDKGYLVMTTEWFKEYGFEVAIDKKYLPKKLLEILKEEPRELEPWDPMGALTS